MIQDEYITLNKKEKKLTLVSCPPLLNGDGSVLRLSISRASKCINKKIHKLLVLDRIVLPVIREDGESGGVI